MCGTVKAAAYAAVGARPRLRVPRKNAGFFPHCLRCLPETRPFPAERATLCVCCVPEVP